MKKTLGALAMSCALAVGMSVPAFAADTTPANEGENTVPVTTVLSSEPLTLQAEVPTSIPIIIRGIVPDQICSKAILPLTGDLKIVNKSNAPLKMTAAKMVAGADNASYETWALADLHNATGNPPEDSLSFDLGIFNDAHKDFSDYAYGLSTKNDYKIGNPAAYWIYESVSPVYANFAEPFPTNNAFTIDITDARVFVTQANSAAKILNVAKNYFSLVFTLSL